MDLQLTPVPGWNQDRGFQPHDLVPLVPAFLSPVCSPGVKTVAFAAPGAGKTLIEAYSWPNRDKIAVNSLIW